MRVIAQMRFQLCLCLAACILAAACAAHGDPGPDEAVDPADFARTEGTWNLKGTGDAAVIEMDWKGHFTSYYASGAEANSGNVTYVDEYDDGNGRYDLYDKSGKFIMGFYFDSETQFHIGNDDGDEYVKVNQAKPKAN